MPNVNDLYPSEWLKWDAVDEGDWTLTIKKDGEVEFKDMKTGQPRKQIVLYFEETELKLGLNPGNAKTLATLFGPDSEDWIGKKIVIGSAKSNSGTMYVQVREGPTKGANRAKPQAKPQPQARPQPLTQAEVDDDPEIPF